jgi:small nuclear ribonucleoprotein (snRNP)-like protein
MSGQSALGQARDIGHHIPEVRSRSTCLELRQVVRNLQQQHVVILGKFDDIANLILDDAVSLPDKAIKDRLVKETNEVFEMLLEHARLEDEKLYPYLEGRQVAVSF